MGWTTCESNSASNSSSVQAPSAPQPHPNDVVAVFSAHLGHRVQRIDVVIAFDPHMLSLGDADSAERPDRPNSLPDGAADLPASAEISLLGQVYGLLGISFSRAHTATSNFLPMDSHIRMFHAAKRLSAL